MFPERVVGDTLTPAGSGGPTTPRRGVIRWLLSAGALVLAVALVSGVTVLVASWALAGDQRSFGEAALETATRFTGTTLQAAWPLPRDRFTVLLVGSDRRPNTATRGRADTIILASLDPVGKTAALVSIPRDLWVTMRLGNGETRTDRINSATLYGEAGYPGGGIGLLKDTVATALGVRIDRWVRVELSQFPTIVDTLGGVEVNPRETVEDGYQREPGGPIIPLYVPPGPQRLNGEQALWYARTRRQGADIGRMERQQQVVLGLKQQALQVGTLTRLPELWGQLQDLVQTDLRLPELLALAPVVLDVPREHVTTVVIDWQYAQSKETEQGWQVLEPDWEAIRRAVRAALYDVKVRSSVGQVEVVNRSGRPGAGQGAAAVLNRQGISQTTVQEEPPNAADPPPVTVVRTKAGQRQAGLLVARLLGLADGQVEETRSAASEGPTLRVILGRDAPKLE